MAPWLLFFLSNPDYGSVIRSVLLLKTNLLKPDILLNFDIYKHNERNWKWETFMFKALYILLAASQPVQMEKIYLL